MHKLWMLHCSINYQRIQNLLGQFKRLRILLNLSRHLSHLMIKYRYADTYTYTLSIPTPFPPYEHTHTPTYTHPHTHTHAHTHTYTHPHTHTHMRTHNICAPKMEHTHTHTCRWQLLSSMFRGKRGWSAMRRAAMALLLVPNVALPAPRNKKPVCACKQAYFCSDLLRTKSLCAHASKYIFAVIYSAWHLNGPSSRNSCGGWFSLPAYHCSITECK
jgi:hypothetical protein